MNLLRRFQDALVKVESMGCEARGFWSGEEEIPNWEDQFWAFLPEKKDLGEDEPWDGTIFTKVEQLDLAHAAEISDRVLRLVARCVQEKVLRVQRPREIPDEALRPTETRSKPRENMTLEADRMPDARSRAIIRDHTRAGEFWSSFRLNRDKYAGSDVGPASPGRAGFPPSPPGAKAKAKPKAK